MKRIPASSPILWESSNIASKNPQRLCRENVTSASVLSLNVMNFSMEWFVVIALICVAQKFDKAVFRMKDNIVSTVPWYCKLEGPTPQHIAAQGFLLTARLHEYLSPFNGGSRGRWKY